MSMFHIYPKQLAFYDKLQFVCFSSFNLANRQSHVLHVDVLWLTRLKTQTKKQTEKKKRKITSKHFSFVITVNPSNSNINLSA